MRDPEQLLHYGKLNKLFEQPLPYVFFPGKKNYADFFQEKMGGFDRLDENKIKVLKLRSYGGIRYFFASLVNSDNIVERAQVYDYLCFRRIIDLLKLDDIHSQHLYRLSLIPSDDDNHVLRRNTVYVQKNATGGIHYKVLVDDGQVVEGIIPSKELLPYDDGRLVPGDLASFEQMKTQILEATAKRGHAPFTCFDRMRVHHGFAEQGDWVRWRFLPCFSEGYAEDFFRTLVGKFGYEALEKRADVYSRGWAIPNFFRYLFSGGQIVWIHERITFYRFASELKTLPRLQAVSISDDGDATEPDYSHEPLFEAYHILFYFCGTLQTFLTSVGKEGVLNWKDFRDKSLQEVLGNKTLENFLLKPYQIYQKRYHPTKVYINLAVPVGSHKNLLTVEKSYRAIWGQMKMFFDSIKDFSSELPRRCPEHIRMHFTKKQSYCDDVEFMRPYDLIKEAHKYFNQSTQAAGQTSLSGSCAHDDGLSGSREPFILPSSGRSSQSAAGGDNRSPSSSSSYGAC